MSDSPEIQELTMLRQQLAAMTAERDEWQKKANWKHVHDDSLEIELQQQFAASQARCMQLEEGVKLIALHIEATQLCEINPYDILKTCKELLTPTERPPA